MFEIKINCVPEENPYRAFGLTCNPFHTGGLHRIDNVLRGLQSGVTKDEMNTLMQGVFNPEVIEEANKLYKSGTKFKFVFENLELNDIKDALK